MIMRFRCNERFRSRSAADLHDQRERIRRRSTCPNCGRRSCRRNPTEIVRESQELAVQRQDRSLLRGSTASSFPVRAERLARLQEDAEELAAERIGGPLLEEVIPRLMDDPATQRGDGRRNPDRTRGTLADGAADSHAALADLRADSRRDVTQRGPAAIAAGTGRYSSMKETGYSAERIGADDIRAASASRSRHLRELYATIGSGSRCRPILPRRNSAGRSAQLIHINATPPAGGSATAGRLCTAPMASDHRRDALVPIYSTDASRRIGCSGFGCSALRSR